MARATYIWAFVVCLGVGVAGHAVTPFDFDAWEDGENLLVGGDFEDVTMAGTVLNGPDGSEAWNLEDGTCCDRGADYAWELDDSESHTGDQSMKIIGNTASGTDWHAKVRHDSASMKGGEDYTVAFWAKATKARPVSLSIQLQHDPWTSFQGGDWTLIEEWAEYTRTFLAPVDNDRDMWVGLSLADSDVDFWLDDFRFWQGELKDEIGADPATRSVDAHGKLSLRWAGMKR
ncbi:hypothetical protein HN371_19460 [Candidatus Poribacteria bacterium]|jgi:hypothetical protein|nr:hypothetical protein [Candidatus Poribacteria bacterium]MBT5534954.1 hypothetical protein [Candidatus Poribacteria bacterium]MBT5709595.1 hypothetical protein [Candidatus Poribacteria bacterium]MBT7097128.1 hypothetical protein [Candidatus Poribacteria bacterium]MBT7804366.1 hypothetical protein [Candidatus Poribacteria bacterium]